MPTFLQGIANKAQAQPQHRFGNLYELLNEAYLKECWHDIRKDAAYGVDRVSAQDYEQYLDENIHDLVERLKQKQYRAKLVRRVYIPKGDNRWRPLGIPAIEDKLLQLAVTRIRLFRTFDTAGEFGAAAQAGARALHSRSNADLRVLARGTSASH